MELYWEYCWIVEVLELLIEFLGNLGCGDSCLCVFGVALPEIWKTGDALFLVGEAVD